MFPFINLNEFKFHTNTLLVLASILFSIVFYTWMFKKEGPFYKHILFVFSMAFATLLGSRLFYAFFVMPQILQTPEMIWSRSDGLTFYGGGIIAFPILFFFGRWVYKNESRSKLWDTSAILAAFLGGVLRIGCFASGCCWGSITTVPWAIRYTNPESFMPHLGIPVHPVATLRFFGQLPIGNRFDLFISKKALPREIGSCLFLWLFSFAFLYRIFSRGCFSR